MPPVRAVLPDFYCTLVDLSDPVRSRGFDDFARRLARPYVIFYSGVAGADLGFCCLIGPGGDLRSWLRWLRCVEAERDRLAEQLEYAVLFRGRC